MNSEMAHDIAEAVDRLRYSFTKHGLAAPLAVAVGSGSDFEILRNLSSSMALYSGIRSLPENVACQIGGIALVRTALRP